MANYKVRFSRDLTEEESHEIDDIMNSSDIDYLIYSDDDSEFDLIDAESAVDDIELYELQHSIEDEMIQEGMEEEEEVEVEVDVEEADPVEPNRGEKYVAQGKKPNNLVVESNGRREKS